MKKILMVLAAASFSFAQWGGWGGGGGGGKSINDYKKESVSGRDIHVWVPANLPAKSPLLLSLHGMDQDPNYQQQNTHWENVADTAGFVVVYPRGGTGMSTWDISGDQDTKWVTQIIDQMAKEYDIDTRRVYLSGFSMGGMFTYHSMSKIADKIAAFAPCSGTNVMGASKAQRPVPIFHPHGTNDDVLPYNQVEGFIKNYRDQFNCPSQAQVQDNYPNSENPNATLYTWGPCDGNVTIKHLKLQGRGHSPSAADVSDIWNFIKLYDVDGLISDKPKTETPDTTAAADTSKADTAKTDKDDPNAGKTDTTKTDKDNPSTGKDDPNAGTADKDNPSAGKDDPNAGAADKDDPNAGKDDPGVGGGDKTSIANKAFMVSVEKSYSVYNMNGSFVCELKASRIGDVQSQLNSMRLDKGLYVVKNSDFNRIFSVK